MPNFPFYKQLDSKDCGPTCLKIIAKHYGRKIPVEDLRAAAETSREGSNLLFLSEAAEKIGLRSLGARLNTENLKEASLPCILHWNTNHYVVLYKIKKDCYYISDPAIGLISYNQEEFLKFWTGSSVDDKSTGGIALLLETSPNFYAYNDGPENKTLNIKFLSKYLFRYKSFLIQLFIGLLATSLLQIVFPFLTQSIVDVGIQSQNIHFIVLILIAQIVLFISRTGLEHIRGWIVLHLSTRLNINLISDFFVKLMNLPISFFDSRMTGDILQRINDHSRIEKVMTTSSLNVLFSMFNLLVMGAVLAYYSFKIFLVFIIGSALYFGWIFLFLKKREILDYKRFSEISQEQSKVIELINGMQEIKLHNAERQKRWGWEHLQARLFKVSIEGLKLEQGQLIGSNFINEIKNIFIIFMSAKLVVDGDISLGMMMAITSIAGSLNGPVMQLIGFIREAQDAKISLARLSEIHEKKDELQIDSQKIDSYPYDAAICIKNLTFRYEGSSKNVLKKLNLTIPANKVTAIVGASGSGKTTLMKILLKFYEPHKGEIILKEPDGAKTNLNDISQKTWRSHIGAVMQEGYIFNDTIANNIAIGANVIDRQRLDYSSDTANIREFINSTPLGFNTKIGMEGHGISTGQKQRLLIARAVYKNPEMLFFDEATSALDANNEKDIVQKLDRFFKGKTVVVIAHRLSTVINADQIIVLDEGKVAESGTHEELIQTGGSYYNLIKNQLQLSYAK
ncbi:MAG: ABC transporter ATP-binding protein [Flavobacterium psychrophilum]|nr:MAG: ABC transporter ATP-binding protein [Flavobacterium psychrophilum]